MKLIEYQAYVYIILMLTSK